MNTPPLFPPIDNTIFIDNSTLERFTKCARSFEYYAVKRRCGGGTRIALNFGTAVHAALEARYKGLPLADQVATGHAALAGIEIPPEEHRNATFLTDVLNKYDAYCLVNDDFEPIKVDSTPFVEHSFALPLGSVAGRDGIRYNVVYTGKIDLLVKHNGRIMPVDHKTTSMFGPSFFDEFVNSSQPHGYAWAASQLLNQPIDGYIINAIVVRKPTRTGTAIDFARQPYFIEPGRVTEWRENTLWLIQRAVNDWLNGMFPMETCWCVGRYGKCEYFDVCTVQKEGREKVLNSNLYANVTWNPLHT